MKKRLQIFLIMIISTLTFAACGKGSKPDSVVCDTLVIDKSGEITAYITGEFDKDYYKVDELATMAENEVEDYNSTSGAENGNSVVFTGASMCEGAPDRVMVTYSFSDLATYNDFLDG